MTFARMLGAIALAAGLSSSPAAAQQLTVWHDLGDNGIAWFQRMGAEFARVRPGVTIRSLSFPTEQWFGRAIGAINTDTAPDLIFNNYERVIRVQSQTSRLVDMRAVLEASPDRSFLGADELRVATYRGRMLIIPVHRVQMALAVRRSWLERVGERFPETWEDMRRIAGRFRENPPPGATAANTFAFASQAARPRDLIHMLDLFVFGSGLTNTLIDPDGQIVIDRPAHAEVLQEFLRAHTSYGFVAPDTINHSFTEMYQVIEGGRAGMFRLGDWNVRRWDMPNQLGGDFVAGPWPRFAAGRENAVVAGGMRGVAIPENSPNRELAAEFARFMLTRAAQQASLEIMGAFVRNDLDASSLSPNQQWFARAQYRLVPYDFPESVHPWYPELEAAFHRRLLAGLASPPTNGDWGPFIATLAQEMRAEAQRLARAN